MCCCIPQAVKNGTFHPVAEGGLVFSETVFLAEVEKALRSGELRKIVERRLSRSTPPFDQSRYLYHSPRPRTVDVLG